MSNFRSNAPVFVPRNQQIGPSGDAVACDGSKQHNVQTGRSEACPPGGSKPFQRDTLELSRMQQAARRLRIWKDEWVCQGCTKRSFLEGTVCRACGKERDASDRLVLYSEAWRCMKVPDLQPAGSSAKPRHDKGSLREASSAGGSRLRGSGDTCDVAASSYPWHYEASYKQWAEEPFRANEFAPALKDSSKKGAVFPQIRMAECVAITVFTSAVAGFLNSSFALEVAFFAILAVLVLLQKSRSKTATKFGSLWLTGIAPPRKRATAIVDEVVARAGSNPDKVLGLYAKLRELSAPALAEAVKNSSHSAEVLYSAVLSSAGRTKQPKLVVELFDDMERSGVSPTIKHYESAMRLLAGLHCFRQALDVHEKLQARGLTVSRVMQGYLVNFAAEVGDLDLAVQFFNHISAEGVPTQREYMLGLRVMSKRKDWPRCLAIYRDCEARGRGVDRMMLNVTLATGAAWSALASDDPEDRQQKRRDFVSAKALLHEATEASPSVVDVISFNTVLKGCAQTGDDESVLPILTRMTEVGIPPNTITYNTAIDASIRRLVKLGARSNAGVDAWHLLDAMRDAGLHPDDFTCSILLKGVSLYNVSQLSGMLDVLEELGRKMPRLDVALQNVNKRAAIMKNPSNLLERVRNLMQVHYPESLACATAEAEELPLA